MIQIIIQSQFGGCLINSYLHGRKSYGKVTKNVLKVAKNLLLLLNKISQELNIAKIQKISCRRNLKSQSD